MSELQPWLRPSTMPRWVWKAVGHLLAGLHRDRRHPFGVVAACSALFLLLLVSLFLSLAVEPGVNRLAARGWRRGTATA